jgi:hypothetical protein
MTDRCPALTDLASSELWPEIEDHLTTCRRCRALRAALPRQEGKPSPREARSSTSEIRRRPSTGDFGLITTFDESTNLVAFVAAVRNGEAIVVPVSDETNLATDWDLLIDQTLLGYPAMVEAWNSGVVLVEQLQEAIVSAPESVRTQVTAMLKATEIGEAPEGLCVGVPVLSPEDPRILFQESEAEYARRYWQPRMVLSSAATIGELVSLRQAELELSKEELEPLYDRPSWFDDLVGNRLALDQHEDAVVNLFKTLQLTASDRLGSLLRHTVEQHSRLAQINAGVQFNRRRTGMSGASELQQEDTRGVQINAFVRRVMQRLSEE